MMQAPASSSPIPLPLGLKPPPTSCCPGWNIPFCTLSVSHSLLETGARRLKPHSFSWDFCLFAPSSLPLLCVNISWAQGGGKELPLPVLTAVYREKQELPSQGQLYQDTGENFRYKGFTSIRLGFFYSKNTGVLLKPMVNLSVNVNWT